MPPPAGISSVFRGRRSHGHRLVVLLLGLSFYSWIAARLASREGVLWEAREDSGHHGPPVLSQPKASVVPYASTNENENANSTRAPVLVEGAFHDEDHDPHRHPNFTFGFPLCLVHVGKTAGSSVSCGLGLMYANCEGMPRQPPVPHVEYFHMRKNNCRRNTNNNNNNNNNEVQSRNTATFLMTVRNPLTRIRSWFDFEKDRLPTRRNKQDEQRLRWKRGMLFAECYDDFVELITKGLEPLPASPDNHSNNDNDNDGYIVSAERPVNMTCAERAWAAVLGVREFSYHEWYNYEHYWTALQPDLSGRRKHSNASTPSPSLLVLRTEHLAEDWSKLSTEPLFRRVNRGPRGVDAPMAQTASHTTHSAPTDDSKRFWTNLCRAMCPELKVYQTILQTADNLEASDVEESMREISALCPKYQDNGRSSSDSSSGCPGIPRFPLLKVPRRKYHAETKKRLFAIGR